MTTSGLARVRASAAQLMDPSTRPRDAAAIARRDPAILWIAGNVHGGEESGTDASLRVLYELADRTDCAAQQILDNAVVVILPTQNPDGREADTRRNAYGFDMNRDWFARTQPETDGKLEMLRRYPPVLFIDAHEMGGTTTTSSRRTPTRSTTRSTDQAVSLDQRPLRRGNAATSSTRAGIPYFNYDVYDLFYLGYGDTVPATGFGAAGMTFEKASGDAASAARATSSTSRSGTRCRQAALNKQRDPRPAGTTAGSRRVRQGARRRARAERGRAAGATRSSSQVPDLKVRHYFLRADDPAKAREVQALVRRLQRMDVEVRRLTQPLPVPRLHAVRPARRATRAAGRHLLDRRWPRRQKHWVQAMLNEDTYMPFPYFYDVTAWSQPLLFNVAGGYSGRRLADLRSAPVPAQADPGVPDAPADAPRIALYSMSPQFTRGIESAGWLHYLLDRWGLEYTDVSARTSRPARSTTPTCSSSPTATPRSTRTSPRIRTASATSARRARPRSGAGSRTAAATSAGSTARVLASGVGVSSATF